MKWYVLEKNQNFNLPEWARTFGVNDEDIVFVPAGISPVSENEVYDRSSDVDIFCAQYNDHMYMPSNWLGNEFPEVADLCRMFENQAEKIKGENVT